MNVKEYREVCGCHNCEHVFRLDRYDEGSRYFCTFGAKPRPRCGSVGMKDERYTREDHKEGGEYDKWEEWSEDKEVQPWGTCEKFQKHILTNEELEEVARDKWNFTADEYNQWDSLGQDEKDDLILEVKTSVREAIE